MKNDEIELQIEDLSVNGDGIGHADGKAIFVPGALPGDYLRAGITKELRSYSFARIIKIISPSADRVEPRCPISSKCGGCQLQNMKYEAQLLWKENHVKDLLERVGGFERDEVDRVTGHVFGMEEPWRYRNKAQYPVRSDRDGNIVTGFYARHSHRVVPCHDCLIGSDKDQKLLDTVTSWMKRNHVRPYDENNNKGLIRHILIRHAVQTNETMVCLVAASNIPDADGLSKDLMSCGVESVVININKTKGNVILGHDTKLLAGQERIFDKIKNLSFAISARSFYQVNPVQTEKLYGKAIEFAGLTGLQNVYDLYCGTGTITLCLAEKAAHVTGIEIVDDAVRDAKENARRNGIRNVSFYAGAVEKILPDLIKKKKADVVVMDPPRKGCDIKVLEAVMESKPDRVIYVSCDPATLARDLGIMKREYDLKEVQPVDMFPETVGIENVCCMLRKNRKGKA